MDPLTRLISARRGSAERLAVLIDRPPSAAPRDRLPLDAPLHDAPLHDGPPRDPLLDLARLAERVAEQGRSMGEVAAPSPHFRTALRTRLLAVAAVSVAGAAPTVPPVRATPWRDSRRGKRTLEVAAGSLACLVAVGGVAAAGEQSGPGDPFFGVKRTVEAVQLATSDGELAKGRQHLQFAANRLDEVRELSFDRAGTPRERERKLSRGLDEMDREVRAGTEQLTRAFRRVQGQGRTAEERAPLQALSRFAASQGVSMQRLLGGLPPASRERATASMALVAGVGADADELLRLGTCSPDCRTAIEGAVKPEGAAAGPCDCAGDGDGDGDAGAGSPPVDTPAGSPTTGPGATGPGATDPRVPDPGSAVPTTAPAPGGPAPIGGVPGSTPGRPGQTPLLPVPPPNVPLPGGGPILPAPLPGVPVLPPGPTLPGASSPGGRAPTLAPSLPVERPTLAPPAVPLPGGPPIPR